MLRFERDRWPGSPQDATLEPELGDALYLEVISTDFRDEEAVWSLRDRLGIHARTLPGPPLPMHPPARPRLVAQ